MMERLRDYTSELSLGKILGRTGINIEGHNPDINSAEEVIWDYGGLYTYLTSNTTLYISSDEIGDTNQVVVVVGLDSTGNPVIAQATLNGQNQVELVETIGTSFYRVCAIPGYPGPAFITGPNEPAGNIYIAEQGDLTGGVPDDITTIKAYIENGNNLARQGLATAPSGTEVLLKAIRGSVGKLQDASLFFRIRLNGGVWWSPNPFQIYQNNFEFNYPFGGITFPALTDFEMSATSTVNAEISLEVDAEYVETAKLSGEVK
jgi:hypothetical protein